MTFNPSGDSNARPLTNFTDIRNLQRQLKAQRESMLSETDEQSSGPASFMINDSDENPY